MTPTSVSKSSGYLEKILQQVPKNLLTLVVIPILDRDSLLFFFSWQFDLLVLNREYHNKTEVDVSLYLHEHTISCDIKLRNMLVGYGIYSETTIITLKPNLREEINYICS
jgi:hypothetical protein